MKNFSLLICFFCLTTTGCDQISARLAALRPTPLQASDSQPSVIPAKDEERLDSSVLSAQRDSRAIQPSSSPDRLDGDQNVANQESIRWGGLKSGHPDAVTKSGSLTNQDLLPGEGSRPIPSITDSRQAHRSGVQIEIGGGDLKPRINMDDGRIAIEIDSDSIRVRSGTLEGGK